MSSTRTRFRRGRARRLNGRKEAVIPTRFEVYMAVPARKIEAMRPVAAVVDEIVGVLALEQT